jgi:hypothetical protein
LLVSFRRYFVIDEDSLCISTMYYLFQWIYMVLIVKKKKSSTDYTWETVLARSRVGYSPATLLRPCLLV